MFYSLMIILLFFNEDFDKVTFIANQRHILGVDLDKINLENDNNFDEDKRNFMVKDTLR